MKSALIGAIAWCVVLMPSSRLSPTELIRIVHIGPEDKPIPVLVIATDQIKVPPTENLVIVTRDTFQKIVRQLRSSTLKNSTAPSNPQFGAFQIRLASDDEEERLYLATRANALRVFKELRDWALENDTSGQLDNHLSYLISRTE